MKLSSVALSFSAVALTASAAAIPESPQSPRTAIRFGHPHDNMNKRSSGRPGGTRHIGRGHSGNDRHISLAPLAFIKRAQNSQKRSHEGLSTSAKRRLPDTDVPCEHGAATSMEQRTTPHFQEVVSPPPPPSVKPRKIARSTISMTKSGVPGFVEVAIPDSKSGLARTVSGLAYSTNPAASGSGFDLGTSPSHSTQFFMSAINGTDGASLYRLSVPILDSATFKTTDHCATFAISPPGPLSLQKCGLISGSSQIFSYDSASGELQPVYTPSATKLISGSGRQVIPLENFTARPQAYVASEDPSKLPVTSNPGLPVTPNSSVPSAASAVLFFVPAEGFYEPSSTLRQLMAPPPNTPTTSELPVANATRVSDDSLGRNIMPSEQTSKLTAANQTAGNSAISFTDLPSVNVSEALLTKYRALEDATTSSKIDNSTTVGANSTLLPVLDSSNTFDVNSTTPVTPIQSNQTTLAL